MREKPSLLAGDTPPRLHAPAGEDPWHPDFESNPERWVGAEGAHAQVRAVNLKNAVESTLAGGFARNVSTMGHSKRTARWGVEGAA